MTMKVKLQLNSKAKPSTKNTSCSQRAIWLRPRGRKHFASAEFSSTLSVHRIQVASEGSQITGGWHTDMSLKCCSDILLEGQIETILKPLKRKTRLHSRHCSLISRGCRWQNIGDLYINFCTGSFKMCHRKLQLPNILVELFFFLTVTSSNRHFLWQFRCSTAHNFNQGRRSQGEWKYGDIYKWDVILVKKSCKTFTSKLEVSYLNT